MLDPEVVARRLGLLRKGWTYLTGVEVSAWVYATLAGSTDGEELTLPPGSSLDLVVGTNGSRGTGGMTYLRGCVLKDHLEGWLIARGLPRANDLSSVFSSDLIALDISAVAGENDPRYAAQRLLMSSTPFSPTLFYFSSKGELIIVPESSHGKSLLGSQMLNALQASLGQPVFRASELPGAYSDSYELVSPGLQVNTPIGDRYHPNTVGILVSAAEEVLRERHKVTALH